MYTIIRIDFLLQDFVEDIQEVTDFIGLKPDKAHLKGEFLERNPKVKWQHNTWLISSKADDKESFETHLNDILNKINSRYDKLIEMSKKCKVYLNCVVTMYNGDRPFIKFDKESIKILHELNAEIEFDIYNL